MRESAATVLLAIAALIWFGVAASLTVVAVALLISANVPDERDRRPRR